jgi:hypothetical protein
MATAVEMKNGSSFNGERKRRATCFATVGYGNALPWRDPARGLRNRADLHTINMILTVQPKLSDEAMVEAVQIVTEGRVRALYEKGIKSPSVCRPPGRAPAASPLFLWVMAWNIIAASTPSSASSSALRLHVCCKRPGASIDK